MAGFEVNLRTNAHSVAMEFSLAGREMEPALVRALNKTTDQGKVQTSRAIRDVGGYNLKASVIKAGIKVRRASQGQLKAAIVSSGRPVPLIKYSARQTAKGVTVLVQKGRKLIAGAFIATMPTGHQGVYVREANARHKRVGHGSKASWHALPIRELFGPSVPDGMANPDVRDAVLAFMNEKFPSILEHEHEWLRSKLKR